MRFRFRLGKITSLFIVLLLILPVAVLTAEEAINARNHTVDSKKVITITSGEYAPWVGRDLPHGGFINHIIALAFAKSGYKVQFRFLPWKRAYDEVKMGVYPASSYWYDSTGRSANFVQSKPIFTESVYFIYNKAKPLKKWNTLDDLKGFTIGATDGFTYTKGFWDRVKNKKLNVELTTSDDLNLRKLMSGRVDLVPIERHVAYHLILKDYGKQALKKIDFNPKPLVVKTDRLLFSKKYPDVLTLVSAFNKGLAIIQKEGVITRLKKQLLQGSYYKEKSKVSATYNKDRKEL